MLMSISEVYTKVDKLLKFKQGHNLKIKFDYVVNLTFGQGKLICSITSHTTQPTNVTTF